MAENKKPTLERQRIKYGSKAQKLVVKNTIPGHELAYINDVGGRIKEYEDRGYSFVAPEEVGERATDDDKVKVLVGDHKDGSAMYAYLMKIPTEWKLEDDAIKREHNENIERAIKGGNIGVSNSYVPPGGIKIQRK